ncbi:MAG: UvrD-helicase domain-containing protein [Crocinitomicaceae bacterium]|nr:UvrD-helicase domain-containing protein [Crocinitomicaceae bacterium]
MSTTHKYLKVVNASAGSGKTFSLVKTYIQLLLLDDGDNAKKKYAEILAMTFTNKAAIEMKTRIVKALDELAYPSFHQSNYIETIVKETDLKKDVIQKKAQYFLSSILHNYEDFNVMTIDKFNLRLIRSFSRDLDLPPDFEVVLDENSVLEQVVDNIINEIGKDKVLTNLLTRYANEKIEEEKRWDLRSSLIDFGRILTKEQDLPYVERLMNMEFSEDDFNAHKKEIKGLNDELRRKAKDVADYFYSCNFDTKDFSRGKDIFSSIKKISERDYKFGEKGPFSPTQLENSLNAASKGADFATFHQKAQDLSDWYASKVGYYEILNKFLKNYFNMALLKHLNEALLAMNKQERLIRISEFNTKISSLLQEDTLYIYEKLGTRFRHFMLDEFQDTSRLQWLNLIPLVRESLGNGNDNFIVGDSKQAIYRFKNGVAEQFVALPKIYNPENDPKIAEASEYFDQMGYVDNLEDNWRSAPEIVNFNNDLFSELRTKLNDEQRDFYKSVKQNPKSKLKGYIHIESKIEKENDNIFESYYNFALKSINDALEDGFKPGDICILTKRNALGNYLATNLSESGFSVVSADSLMIDSELTVRFIINYFKLRLNPVNQNIIRRFLHSYCELFELSLDYYNSLFEEQETKDGKIIKFANLDLFLRLNPSFQGEFFAPFETLYDLIQKAFKLFGLNELHNPYIHHLADLVFNYESKNGPDLSQFVNDYDSLSKESKALQIPESDEALKIMTIHKSKGLEFPVVIVITEANSSNKFSQYFVETENYLLYSNLSKNSLIPEIVKANEEEESHKYLDDLNLFYVAYTRPTTRLYLYNEGKPSNVINANIHAALKNSYKPEEDGDELVINIGEKVRKEEKETDASSNDQFFLPQSSTDNLWFPDISLQDSEELIDQDYLSDEQRYGNQFHIAISSINGKEEIDVIVKQLINEGQIEQLFETKLIQELTKLFSSAAYNQLFEKATGILSEQNYIISKNEQIRPDKIITKDNQTIVVDYKTGQPLKKHTKQVQQYCSVLQEMDYPNVEGYLFYTKELKLERVV